MPRHLSLGLVASFVIAATACGANPDPSDVEAAGVSVRAPGSARVETVTRVSVGSTAKTFEFRSTGIVDYVRNRRLDREESSGCRTITIGDLTYSELAAGEGFPAGKHWAESGSEAVDDEALFERSQKQSTDEEGGMTTHIFFLDAEPAPHDYLSYLRESGEPERVGEEAVRGVPTTHYRGEVDIRSRTEAELQKAGWKAANVERYLEGIEATRDIDIWVDSEGRVRRVVTTDASPGADVGMSGDWVTTTEYFDFGLETDIQRPPAAEVLDSEEWQRVVEKRTREEMRAWQEEALSEDDESSQPLPGAFEPSTLPGADSEQPASCLH